MRKTHDAELCERIRVLEERVRELEFRPTQIPHYCWSGCPHHYGTAWPNPYPWPIWYSSSSGVSTGTITMPNGTQTTYTLESGNNAGEPS
jgi:hypothetical protein